MRKNSPLVGLLVALATMAVVPQQTLAQATSTPEERTHWIELAHKLESNPLDKSLNKDAEVALKRLIEVTDVHITVCSPVFVNVTESNYKYKNEVTRQYTLGSAAFVLESPSKASDANAVNFAAVQSVLKFYGAILQQKPNAKSPKLDDLLTLQSQGKLEDMVSSKCAASK